jgi:hypothetical protein
VSAELIRQLYGTDPAEFVTERNRIAKELKAGGDADLAEAVKGLRRPKLAEHALNRVARDQPDLIRRFTDAAQAAADAQSAAITGAKGDLREATAALRQVTVEAASAAVAALVAGGSGGEGQRDEITDLLREAIAAGPELLRAGVLGSAEVELPAELFAGMPEPAARPATASAQQAAPSKSKSKEKAAAKPAAKPDPVVPRLGAKEARERKAIEAKLDRARRDAHRAVSDIDLAIADVEAEITTRARRLATLQSQRDGLAATLDAATFELDRFNDGGR